MINYVEFISSIMNDEQALNFFETVANTLGVPIFKEQDSDNYAFTYVNSFRLEKEGSEYFIYDDEREVFFSLQHNVPRLIVNKIQEDCTFPIEDSLNFFERVADKLGTVVIYNKDTNTFVYNNVVFRLELTCLHIEDPHYMITTPDYEFFTEEIECDENVNENIDEVVSKIQLYFGDRSDELVLNLKLRK